MKITPKSSALGLDIGSTGARAVVLELKGKNAVLKQANTLDARSEGLLGNDSDELRKVVSQWLKEHFHAVCHTVLHVPEFMATLQIKDFMANIKKGVLEDLVQFETNQISSISTDELFVHDYVQMPPGNGRTNPVAIGIFRDNSLDEYIAAMQLDGIRVNDASITAIGMTNAFLYLHPETASTDEIHILLDIGLESSTMAIVSHGQLLYTSSLMFGGATVSNAMVKSLGISLDEAETMKRLGTIDWDAMAPASPAPAQTANDEDDVPALGFSGLKLPNALQKKIQQEKSRNAAMKLCFGTLERELTAAIDQWRSAEDANEELAQRQITKIWLCGGAATTPNLLEYIQTTQNCDADLLAPQLPEDTPGTPSMYTIAFGLALQGIGKAALPLSALPSAFLWNLRKEDRSQCLIVAFVLLVLAIGGGLYTKYSALTTEIDVLDSALDAIKKNLQVVKTLDSQKRTYNEILLQSLPIVAQLPRNDAYIKVLTALQDATSTTSANTGSVIWCVYMADRASFEHYNDKNDSSNQPYSNMNNPRRAVKQAQDNNEEDPFVEKWKETLEYEKKALDIINVAPLKEICVVGFIMSPKDNLNALERQIMKSLEEEKDGDEPMFENVRVMTEEERTRCMIRSNYAWENCFATLRNTPALKSYGHKPFFLVLSLEKNSVLPPAANPLAPLQKNKQKK